MNTSNEKSADAATPSPARELPSNTETRAAGSGDTHYACGQSHVIQAQVHECVVQAPVCKSRVIQAQACESCVNKETSPDEQSVVRKDGIQYTYSARIMQYISSNGMMMAAPNEMKKIEELDSYIDKEITDIAALSPMDDLPVYEMIVAMSESNMTKDNMTHEPAKITAISGDDDIYSLHEYLGYHEGKDFIYEYPNGEKMWIMICDCGQVLSSCGSMKLCRVKSLGELQRGLVYNKGGAANDSV